MNAPASLGAAPERLAASVAALADRVGEPDVRAQLHALASLLDSLASPDPGHGQRAGHERAIALALEAGDDAAAIRAMRELAAIDRSAVRTVDWSAASSG